MYFCSNNKDHPIESLCDYYCKMWFQSPECADAINLSPWEMSLVHMYVEVDNGTYVFMALNPHPKFIAVEWERERDWNELKENYYYHNVINCLLVSS